jgi:hypothetical protein
MTIATEPLIPRNIALPNVPRWDWDPSKTSHFFPFWQTPALLHFVFANARECSICEVDFFAQLKHAITHLAK